MRPSKLALATLLLLTALTPFWAGPARGGQVTPDQAGEIAQRQTGGRVLAVKQTDGGYQVKVLTPDGKVSYVFVPNR